MDPVSLYFPMHSTHCTFVTSLLNNPQLNHTSWAFKRAMVNITHLKESGHEFWPRKCGTDS